MALGPGRPGLVGTIATTAAITGTATAASGRATELRPLAVRRAAGVLDDAEFVPAKATPLAG